MAPARQQTRGRSDTIQARGVARTLAVLGALNAKNGQSVSEINTRAGVSRQAVYRILYGLVAAGFVTPGRLPRTYVLTSRVHSLSRGYTLHNLVAEVAAPILDDLQARIVWPTELATFYKFRMRLQDTTRRRSPVVIDGEVIGQTIPILSTALGLAYASACRAPRLQTILNHLRVDGAPKSVPSDRSINRRLEIIRNKGYAWREGGLMEGVKYQTSTIAIPISARDEARAAIGITFISSALSIDQAAKRYLTHLYRAATAIEHKLEETLSRDFADGISA
jgi:IclR family transcriptional regulator, mhp operon transcriptional activator